MVLMVVLAIASMLRGLLIEEPGVLLGAVMYKRELLDEEK